MGDPARCQADSYLGSLTGSTPAPKHPLGTIERNTQQTMGLPPVWGEGRPTQEQRYEHSPRAQARRRAVLVVSEPGDTGAV